MNSHVHRASVDGVNKKRKARWFSLGAVAATVDEVEPSLWNQKMTPFLYSPRTEKYQAAILDQYKLYV